MIQAIICRVGDPPVVESIDPGLEAAQAIVKGYIECVRLAPNIDLWINEEGLFTETFNRPIGGHPIMGDCYIAGHNSEGETISLTDDECAVWMDQLKTWQE